MTQTFVARLAGAICAAALLAGWAAAAPPVRAQSGEAVTDEQPTKPKADDVGEAASRMKGPAGQPECIWIGRRIVSLLWRDDLETAERHRSVYERFGCPGKQIQMAFRCVVLQGDLDPKAADSLARRVHACWINPDLPPVPPEEATAKPAAPGDAAPAQ